MILFNSLWPPLGHKNNIWGFRTNDVFKTIKWLSDFYIWAKRIYGGNSKVVVRRGSTLFSWHSQPCLSSFPHLRDTTPSTRYEWCQGWLMTVHFQKIMSGRLSLPYHTFALFEIVPSAFFVVIIIIIIIIIIIYLITLVKISNGRKQTSRPCKGWTRDYQETNPVGNQGWTWHPVDFQIARLVVLPHIQAASFDLGIK